MQDFILSLGVRFTDEEKEKCISTAYRIIALTKISEDNGDLALKSEILADDDNFLIMGINLIVDGIAPELTEKIFQHSILSSSSSGADLLKMLLVSEGLLSIQRGLGSFMTAYILGAMIDVKYIPNMISRAKEGVNVKEILESHFFTDASSENFEFEKKLLRLTRVELSRVLTSIDSSTMAMAFHKCNKSFVYHMRNGVSENTFIQICKNFKYMQSISTEEMLDAQKQILYRLARLEDMGFIFYPADDEK